MPAVKNAVFHAIRREYRSRTLDIARYDERRRELVAKLAELDSQSLRNRQALNEITSFANQMGWTIKDFET